MDLDALSLRACAREANVSHSAPLHHFGSMAALVSAVATSGFWDFVSVIGQAADSKTDPAESVVEMCRAYVGFGKQNPGLYRVMFGDHTSNTFSEELSEAAGTAWEQLKAAMAKLDGPPEVVEQRSFLIWSIVHGQVMLLITGPLPMPIDPDAAIRGSISTALRAFEQ